MPTVFLEGKKERMPEWLSVNIGHQKLQGCFSMEAGYSVCRFFLF
jgi:hypothetical protein